MRSSFGRTEKVLFGILMICFLGVVVENYYRQKSEFHERLKKEFSGVVSEVEYENSRNIIILENGQSLIGNAEMYDAINTKFRDKKFKEFIFPGDSIFKAAKSGNLHVYKESGDSLMIVIGYYHDK